MLHHASYKNYTTSTLKNTGMDQNKAIRWVDEHPEPPAIFEVFEKTRGWESQAITWEWVKMVPFNRRLIIYPCCLVVFFKPPQPEKYDGLCQLGWSSKPNILMGKCQIHGNQSPPTSGGFPVFHMVKTISFVHGSPWRHVSVPGKAKNLATKVILRRGLQYTLW